MHRGRGVFFRASARGLVDDRQVRATRHRSSMTWDSFAVREMDPVTRSGFELIGRLVRRRRQQLAISQRQLEHLCGVDQTVISRLENGKLGGLRWSRFADLVGALGDLGEADPPPAWTRRLLPPGREGVRA
jgi:hypothetical protein